MGANPNPYTPRAPLDVVPLTKTVLDPPNPPLHSPSLPSRAKEDTFLFSVESTGALPPEEIVLQVMQVLQRKLEVMRGEIDLLESEQMQQQQGM